NVNNPGASTGNLVVGNFIGTNDGGTQTLGNLSDGIQIFGSPGNIIGGTAAPARHNISAYQGRRGGDTHKSAPGKLVLGNLIGTDVTGKLNFANTVDGVLIEFQANNNTVGGLTPSARNVISFNQSNGVEIANKASLNLVEGNYIGTDISGKNVGGNRS